MSPSCSISLPFTTFTTQAVAVTKVVILSNLYLSNTGLSIGTTLLFLPVPLSFHLNDIIQLLLKFDQSTLKKMKISFFLKEMHSRTIHQNSEFAIISSIKRRGETTREVSVSPNRAYFF